MKSRATGHLASFAKLFCRHSLFVRPSCGFTSCCILLCLLLCVSVARGSAIKHKTCGELFDPAALRRVRTFCLDASNLEPGLASEVAAFVARESRPHNLLKHIPWMFTDQCADADAIVRVYFAQAEQHTRIEQTSHNALGGVSYSNLVEPATEVVLLIYDRASLRVLYRTDGPTQKSDPVPLLKGLLSRLQKEIDELGD
jgi:hypothetical protein